MSLNGITLRRASASDWPSIASLLTTHGLPLDGAQQHLSHFVVAHQGAELVGMAGAEVHGKVALLRSVAVAPGRQGQGLGQQLVSRVLDDARHDGARQVFLLTTTAPRYFARFGFSQLGRDQAPEALRASAEFRGACPDSATLMSLSLQSSDHPDHSPPGGGAAETGRR